MLVDGPKDQVSVSVGVYIAGPDYAEPFDCIGEKHGHVGVQGARTRGLELGRSEDYVNSLNPFTVQRRIAERGHRDVAQVPAG